MYYNHVNLPAFQAEGREFESRFPLHSRQGFTRILRFTKLGGASDTKKKLPISSVRYLLSHRQSKFPKSTTSNISRLSEYFFTFKQDCDTIVTPFRETFSLLKGKQSW